jgi:uncharacterized Ntn-hydrolase superfamily protein
VTYSIVARDPQTGELGVAVQSHFFSVGPIVPWALPGVGAVATQALVEVSYGPRALDLLKQGADSRQALAQLVAEDPGSAGRQVAVIDAAGGVAVHTGDGCIPLAGHATAEAVSCQANMMASERVWPKMLDVFRSTGGTLTGRLLAALDAAEAEGGDVRGRQSAAILVVPATGRPWDQVVSLRVEDDPDPLPELRRLVSLHDAYAFAIRGDELMGEGRHDEAGQAYLRAAELAPENDELRFWSGLSTAQMGDLERGVALVREAIAQHAGWRDLLKRLSPEIAPGAAAVRARLDAADG